MKFNPFNFSSSRAIHGFRAVLVGSAIAISGCGPGSSNSPSIAEQEKEIERLRAENQDLPELRKVNEEVRRLKAENRDLAKLRGQAQELKRLQEENERLRSQLAKFQASPK